MPKSKVIFENSKATTPLPSDVARSVGRALERNPREAAVIQSFIERRMKGVVLPKGEAKQAAFVARKYESVLSAVKKSRECREAAKKILGEYEGGLGIRADPVSQRPQPRELIIGVIIGIIVVIVLSGCVKDKPHQTTTTGGGVMQPGTSQNDPVNQGGSGDGGSDAGSD